MLFVFLTYGAAATLAQPSAADIKSHLTGPNVISSVTHPPGTKSWDSAYSKYVWQIGFTNKVKDPKDRSQVLTVTGFLAYDIIGGKYVYWRSFTSSNKLEGQKDLTASEVDALIKKVGAEKFMGPYWRSVVGEIESIGLSKTPKFVWATANSVSFDVVAVYADSRDKGARVARTFHIRLYRDDAKSPWKDNVHGMSQPRDRVIL